MTTRAEGTSIFSEAHAFNTHGGLFNPVARDLHVHYYHHTGDDGSQQQPPTASTSLHDTSTGNANEARADVTPGRSGTWPGSRFRLPGVSRFFRARSLETDVVDIMEAEYTSLVSGELAYQLISGNLPQQSRSSHVASMIPRDSEMYLRLMLKHCHGYPLYRPEPTRGLPMEYRRKGVRIGDVGRITPQGSFDFLFNVDSAQASLVNPSSLPRGFETMPPIEIISYDYFQPGENVLSDYVKQTRDAPITYKFLAAEGAVLQVPEGATMFEARNIFDFYDIAVRHAKNWYEYMITRRSKDVSNGSLYLVTGCIKTANWGIGALYGQPTETDYLEFTSGSQPSQRTYRWKKSGPIATKVGPTATDIITVDGEEPNQCVFLRGYKITLGGKLWKKLKKKLSVSSNREKTFPSSGPCVNNPNGQSNANQGNLPHSTRTSSTSGYVNHSTIIDSPTDRELVHTGLENSDRSEGELDRIILEEFFSVASPMHPLDQVNVMILRIEPEAEVVLVHDNEWCNPLPGSFGANPQGLGTKEFLHNIASSCLVVVDQNGCALLIRKSATEHHQLEGTQNNICEPGHANESPLVDVQNHEEAPSNPSRQGTELNANIQLDASKIHAVVQQNDGKWREGQFSKYWFSPGSETQEEPPSNYANVRSAFTQDMPIELVERILNWLNLLTMLKCRHVCSTFRNVIDSSPYFEWNVELAIAGMEDSGNYSLAKSRIMLAHHQRGWAGLQWTKELRVRKAERKWALRGGVIAQMSNDRSTIHFKRLPSQSRNIEERDWTVDIRRFNLRHYFIVPTQDLLVIIASPEGWRGRRTRQIFLLTLSTGDSHPLAGGMLTHTSTREHSARSDVSVSVCEDILGLKFNFMGPNETEIAFWNWKTGSVVANLSSDYHVAMTFLSQNHVMFGVRTQREPSLVVVDITTLASGCQRLQEVKNIFTFHLPPFAESVQDISIDIHSDGAPACYSDPDLPSPFFAARNRLHVITLLVQTSGDSARAVLLYSLNHSFLSLVDMVSGRNGAEFEWRLWGPGGTRMMLPSSASSRSPGTYKAFASGAKYVTTGQPLTQPVDRIHIYDFNQHALRRSSTNQHEENAPEKEAETPLPYFNVTAPTKIVDNEIFQGEIETRLGYRTKIWAIPGEPKVRCPMCVEDAIVILEEKDFCIFTV